MLEERKAKEAAFGSQKEHSLHELFLNMLECHRLAV